MERIDANQLHERLQHDESRPVLVNTLPRDKFEENNIPGAINIPADEIENWAPKLFKKDQPIVTFCWDEECDASEQAAETLMDMGFRNVSEFPGGIPEWNEAEFPVEHEKEMAATH